MFIVAILRILGEYENINTPAQIYVLMKQGQSMCTKCLQERSSRPHQKDYTKQGREWNISEKPMLIQRQAKLRPNAITLTNSQIKCSNVTNYLLEMSPK